ncbi:MAG TPA: hypothetical protein VMU83_22215 [Hanamia sp.]|nr:hypothetical protein [Hanamia sp.]
MKIDITSLLTIKNFAKRMDVTPAYIYKLIKQGRMKAVEINDVQFININAYPDIPVMNRRK